MARYQFNHVVAAGSWDHFHQGHLLFLNRAFALSQHVTVAITNDTMITHKPMASAIEGFAHRKQAVSRFLTHQKLLPRATVVAINDLYGPTLTDPSLEALVATNATFPGAIKVNQKRKTTGLTSLQLIKVPLAKATDGGVISSERIRLGEINRQGVVYVDYFRKAKHFILPMSLRPTLAQAFGALMTGIGNQAAAEIRKKLRQTHPPIVISVGDVTTNLFLKQKLPAHVYVIDFWVERAQKFSRLRDLGFSPRQKHLQVSNPRGVITQELALALATIMSTVNKNGARIIAPVIVVKGEEDLAVIPAVLAAPLGAVVVYGQPGVGVVWVETTEAKKQEAYELLLKFKPLV